MTTVTLSDIIKPLADADLLITTSVAQDLASRIKVTGLSCDSRVVETGEVFVCKGIAFNSSYLVAASTAGAVAYLAEPSIADELAAECPDMAAIIVRDVRLAMGLVAPIAWDHPDDDLRIVGITGTKGKSTVTYMLRSILDVAAGAEDATAFMGSIETYDGVERTVSINTTPEAPDLWRHLAHARAAGIRTVVMEVSSQALKYHRVDGLRFDVAVFTNLGRDHISAIEHPSMEDYVASKLRIFDQARIAVVNARTDRAPHVLAAAHAACDRVLTFDASSASTSEVHLVELDHAQSSDDTLLHAQPSSVHAATEQSSYVSPASKDDQLSISPRSSSCTNEIVSRITTRFVVHTPTWEGLIHVPLPGAFNVENALAAIAVSEALGIAPSAVVAGLAKTVVPGRMELIADETHRNIVGVVDFAHNAMALENFFPAIRSAWPEATLIAVFGATGDKAVERRHEMPAVAATWADHLIFTEDDAGTELVADICNDMVAAVDGRVSCEVVLDRPEAVLRAVDLARSLDRPAVICLLGRGTESTMHRGNRFIPFPLDAELIRSAFCA